MSEHNFPRAALRLNERRYSRWAGNPDGHPEDTSRCIEEVFSRDDMMHHQCSRKRGHGPDGLYCKTHGRKAEEAA